MVLIYRNVTRKLAFRFIALAAAGHRNRDLAMRFRWFVKRNALHLKTVTPKTKV